MDTSEITNVLLFKDGYYWLTRKIELYNDDDSPAGSAYTVIEGLEYNGFEFASDAYAYINRLQKEVAS